MTDSDVARQAQHVPLTKHVAHKPVALALSQTVLAPGNDACGILAAMLQNGQCIIDGLIDGRLPDDAYDSTHIASLFL